VGGDERRCFVEDMLMGKRAGDVGVPVEEDATFPFFVLSYLLY